MLWVFKYKSTAKLVAVDIYVGEEDIETHP